MRFGYGAGIDYPPSWLEPLQITRTSTDVPSVGTTFVLHTCLLDAAESVGVLSAGHTQSWMEGMSFSRGPVT
jgi:hypothetical protein